MNPIEIIQALPKRMQALYSDGILYFSQDELSGTAERKTLLTENLKVIKAQIEALEKAIG